MRQLLYCFGIGLILSSCTSSFYAPNSHNVPLIGEKYEGTLSASRTSYDRTFATDVQLAFSPIENFAFMANASFFEERNYDSLNLFENYGMRGTFFEGGVGYYKPLGEYLVFDTYAGFGRLSNGGTNVYDAYHATFDYNRIFIQPSIGVKTDILDLAFSVRLNQLMFQNLSYDSIPDDYYYYDEPLLKGNDNFLMVEPAMTIRLGYRYVKFQAQVVTAFNFSANTFPYDRLGFNVGLTFNFKPSYKGKRPPEFLEDFGEVF